MQRRLLVVLLALPLFHAGSTETPAKPCPLPHGKWEPIPAFSDEFNGEKLDTAKWHPNNPTWKGRQPGFFHTKNVRVKDGMLHLDAKVESLPNLPEGYHTFTTAAVKSTSRIRYGYFEIRARAMDSQASSAFWFYDGTPEQWTEIDVFEIGARKHPHRYHMNVHVFHTLVETVHWSNSKTWNAPYNLSKQFHVYGLEWDPEQITFWVDGKVVRKQKDTHWHQALTLNFDSETFPHWFGLPEKDTLPATFSIDYIRAWRRLDGPPDDKPLALEFRFPGRKPGKEESRYRLKTDGAEMLIVRATGGEGERPRKLLLEYDDAAFFAKQKEEEIQKKVTIKDTSGKELTFNIRWNKKPRRGKNQAALKAATPNGYHPYGVDVLAGAKKKGATVEYEFRAEGGSAVKVLVKWP